MFFYKLRKVLRSSWLEILKSSTMLSFIASFICFTPLIFLYHDDFSKNDKRYMFLVSSICFSINLILIYFTDYFFELNIIFSLILGNIFSFCLYLIPCLIIMLYFGFSDLQLDKNEIRDAKLNSLFRKLF